MSVLNKIPFINSVLESLSSENLASLKDLMNGLGDRTQLLRTMDIPSGNRTNITSSDKGVHMCSLQVGPTIFNGYLLYSDDHCVLLFFTDFQRINMFDIDVAKNHLETVDEYLDINELRSTLGDLVGETGSGRKFYKFDFGFGGGADYVLTHILYMNSEEKEQMISQANTSIDNLNQALSLDLPHIEDFETQGLNNLLSVARQQDPTGVALLTVFNTFVSYFEIFSFASYVIDTLTRFNAYTIEFGSNIYDLFNVYRFVVRNNQVSYVTMEENADNLNIVVKEM